MSEGWLLIDCAHRGEVRIALAEPGAKAELGQVHRFDASVPTFTDVLLQFERKTGRSLKGLDAAIAIPGVPTGQATTIERSRWVISPSGLAGMFGRPVTILNEVAAQAWALRATLNGIAAVKGGIPPDLRRRGRYAFFTYEEGVGTAIIDIDDAGRCTVLDAEGGQLDFTPASATERAIAEAVRPAQALVSWEEVLMLRADPAAAALASVPTGERERLFAELLGRFASNLVYPAGAWSGVFMTGRLIPTGPIAASDFDRGFCQRRPYHRFLAKAGCWRVAQAEPVLHGCAAMLAERGAR